MPLLLPAPACVALDHLKEAVGGLLGLLCALLQCLQGVAALTGVKRWRTGGEDGRRLVRKFLSRRGVGCGRRGVMGEVGEVFVRDAHCDKRQKFEWAKEDAEEERKA
ncbi:hypothetical protein IWX49DRAFT_581058 [Phyllosticta citricarpa]